jgi:hypothetical protein
LPLDPIIPGAEWTVQLERQSGDAYVPSANRVLLVLDSPAHPTPQKRLTKQYLPGGGSDTGAEAVGDAVRFTLTPTETATFVGYGGLWRALVFVGDSDEQTYLQPTLAADERVKVISPDGGVIPHA